MDENEFCWQEVVLKKDADSQKAWEPVDFQKFLLAPIVATSGGGGQKKRTEKGVIYLKIKLYLLILKSMECLISEALFPPRLSTMNFWQPLLLYVGGGGQAKNQSPF